jgi:GT2 family glycosyltransferase
MEIAAASTYVYIVIVNYKKWEDARECLDFLFRSDYDGFTVILVDNASPNGSLERLMEWADAPAGPTPPDLPFAPGHLQKPIAYRFFQLKEWEQTAFDRATLPRLIFVQNDNNGGFAIGVNVALRRLLAGDAWVWLLNPDIIVQSDTLSQSLKFAASQPFKTISGPVVRNYAAPHEVYIYGGARINRRSGTMTYLKSAADLPGLDYISGGAFFSHTAHFREIGLLPEEYFIYWEETEWCFMAKQKGYQMKVCETAVCYDKISTTMGRGFRAEYYYTRNGLLFLNRFRENGQGPRMRFVFLRFVKRIVTGQWGKARGVYKGARAYLKMKRL